MEIRGLNEAQVQIADQMWDCESHEEVKTLIALYGRDAVTVYEMILAAYYDENCKDLTQAKEVIDSIKS